jgi:hypothetical protein
MLRILLAMISTASLSAFSAALAPGLAASRSTQSTPLLAQATNSAAPSSSTGPITPPVLKPGQVLPRGSVLNLSV